MDDEPERAGKYLQRLFVLPVIRIHRIDKRQPVFSGLRNRHILIEIHILHGID